MKIKQKLFPGIVIIIMATITLAGCQNASEEERVFYYTETNGTITIVRYNWRKNGSVVIIPAYIKEKPVTSIGDNAFAYNQLTSVTIPDSVTSIGDWAFSGNQLTSVTIPDSVTSIGDWAFSGNQLTSVTIPDSVTYIGDGAFSGNQLTSVTISNSVTSIGRMVFAWNQLTSVTIPDSVTYIGVEAFRDNQLTSITIPNSVTKIRSLAFDLNPNLASITIGEHVLLGTIQHSSFPDIDSPFSPSFQWGFDNTYRNGGWLAGTYVRVGVGSPFFTWERL